MTSTDLRGKVVEIWNATLGPQSWAVRGNGEPVFEGKARVIRRGEWMDCWLVEFLDEPGRLYPRTVYLEDVVEEQQAR